MDSSLYFETSSNLFLLAWLSLFIGYFLREENTWRVRLLFLGGRLIPFGMFVAFVIGVILTRNIEPQGNMFTYEGVIEFFSITERLFNVWNELLALMLVLIRWMIDDSVSRRVNRYWMTICLLAAFVSSAFAFILYWLHTLPRELKRIFHQQSPANTQS